MGGTNSKKQKRAISVLPKGDFFLSRPCVGGIAGYLVPCDREASSPRLHRSFPLARNRKCLFHEDTSDRCVKGSPRSLFNLHNMVSLTSFRCVEHHPLVTISQYVPETHLRDDQLAQHHNMIIRRLDTRTNRYNLTGTIQNQAGNPVAVNVLGRPKKQEDQWIRKTSGDLPGERCEGPALVAQPGLDMKNRG